MPLPHETQMHETTLDAPKQRVPHATEPDVQWEWLRTLRAPCFLGAPNAEVSPKSDAFAVIRGVRSYDLNQRLGALALALGLSLTAIFIAAWGRILSAYSSSPQVFFGVRFPSRRASDQLWPLQLVLKDKSDLGEWLKDTQRRIDGTQRQPSVGLNELRQWCEIPAGQVLLESLVDLTGADLDRAPAHPLEVRLAEEGRDVAFVYHAQHVAADLAQRISEQYLCLLESLTEGIAQTVSSLNLLPAAQRQQVLANWNATAMDYPDGGGLHRLFELQAARTPDAVALVVPRNGDGEAIEERLTYGELNSRANRLGNYLRTLGVDREKRVGLCLRRSADLVVSLLAVLKAGGAYVPLDPAYPVERLKFILEDAQLHCLLTTGSVLDELRGLERSSGQAGCDQATWIRLDAQRESIDRGSDQAPTGTVAPNNLAYVIYTSGSTGRPKGVAIEHRGALALVHWARKVHTPQELSAVLASTSICFDLSVFELLVPLSWGGSVILVENALRLPTLPRSIQVSLINTVPSAISALLRINGIPESVRTINLAGEPLPQSLVRQLYALPWIERVYDLYGPTEDTVYSTFALRRPDAPATIGRPLSNTQVYIVNSDFQPAPIGVPGELCVGGRGLARGYLERPELTAERFVPNPFANGSPSRLYKTGDLARWRPDGNIEFLGRIDHQVKVRGFRIELGEVEATLVQHAHVREAVVAAHDTDSGDKQLVAYVVPKDGAIRPNELRTYLKDRLPSHSVPSRFVTLTALPLTPNGKVDRRALPRPLEIESSGEHLKMPRDPLEIQLKLVFEKILRRHPVSIDASFFDLGGDSLQALRVVVEIERITGKRVPLEILFQAPSVESLAGFLRRQSSTVEWSSLVPLQSGGSRTPVFWVHTTPGDVLGYGNMIWHLGADQPCYGFQSQGLWRADLSHSRVEDMAAHYVTLLRDLRPRGPYFIGGWCYGGIVAVEMAQQLHAAGEEVAPLLLLETPAPAPSLVHFRFHLRRLSRLLQMSPKQWRAYLVKKYEYFRWRWDAPELRFLQAAAMDTNHAETVEEKNGLLARLEQVYRANLRALDRYQPRRYPGKVILFNASEPPPSIIPDPHYGWPGLADDIEMHVIPGNHDAILAEPHVRVLAQKINECLTREQQALGRCS